MTESIKAKGDELIQKFKPKCAGDSQMILNTKLATQCAIIAVEEIIELFFMMPMQDATRHYRKEQGNYWQEVLNYLKSKL